MPEFPQPIEPAVLPTAVMDYSTLCVMGRAARESLTGSRLRRVIGLTTGEVLLVFDAFSREDTGISFDIWLFSAHPQLFRAHPWLDRLPERSEPSHLAEVAGHHLGGATVKEVSVIPFERVLTIDFVRRDYSGEELSYRYIAELMGKHSNLILVDNADTILAAWKPVHSFQSRYREVRAGKAYIPPPPQDKIAPTNFTPTEWRDFINSAGMEDQLDNHFTRTFQGMSLTWAHNVAERAGVFAEAIVSEIASEDAEKLRIAFDETLILLEKGDPLSGEDPEDFCKRIAADLTARAERAILEKARGDVRRVIDRRRKKLDSLVEALAKDLDHAGKADDYKKRADLILANMHLIFPGMSEIEVQDWEADGARVRLKLATHLSPQMQVERLYRRYRKLKRTRDVAGERRRSVAAEEDELEVLAGQLAAATSMGAIEGVREQCALHGLIIPSGRKASARQKRGKGRRSEGEQLRPGERVEITSHRYRSNDGFLILAGTGDRSNDALRRMSHPEDTWLHVRDIRGAHVYIVTRGREVPDTTLKEAAMVAAWHSKAREGSNVPVDYTRAKYVTQIAGSKPGHVTFRRERTIRVTPDEKRIEMMRLMAGGRGG